MCHSSGGKAISLSSNTGVKILVAMCLCDNMASTEASDRIKYSEGAVVFMGVNNVFSAALAKLRVIKSDTPMRNCHL
jgi:hypothetical protein